MEKIVKWTMRFLITLVTVLFVLIGALNWFSAPEGNGLWGHKGYIVKSNSMQPTFSAGDYILVKTIPYSDLENGDVITFLDEDKIVTHRIAGKSAEGIQTKGDANQVNDANSVQEEAYIGKMEYIFAGMGTVLLFLQRPYVFPMILFVVGAYMIYIYVTDEEEEGSEGSTEESPKEGLK